MTGSALAIALLGLASVAACKDPARDAAARAARDKAELDAMVELDAKAEHALNEVGALEKAGKDEDAAKAVEEGALPATNAAVGRAEGAVLATAWGRARRDEMLEAMRARAGELPAYVGALRAHDVEAQLASVTRQIDIEKRAMRAAEAIEQGPPPGAQ